MDATSWIPLLMYLGFILVIVPRLPKTIKQKKLGQDIAKDIVTMLNDPQTEKEIMVEFWNKYVEKRYSSNYRLYKKLLIDEIRYNIEEKKAVLDFFWNSNPMFESEATHEAYHLEIARQISELYPDEIILMKYLKD